MSGRRVIGLFIPLFLACLCAGIAMAQSAPGIGRWLIGGGGCTSATQGNLSLSSAFGQPIAGPSSGGEIRMMAGFWSGGELAAYHPPRLVYLPVALNGYFPWEDCGDSQGDACLIGGCSTELRAYPEDTDDWYAFDLDTVRTLTVQATNVLPQTQLLLYDSAGRYLIHDGSGSSTKTVSYSLQRGYVRMYTPFDHSKTTLYTLAMNRP